MNLLSNSHDNRQVVTYRIATRKPRHREIFNYDGLTGMYVDGKINLYFAIINQIHQIISANV